MRNVAHAKVCHSRGGYKTVTLGRSDRIYSEEADDIKKRSLLSATHTSLAALFVLRLAFLAACLRSTASCEK